MNWSRAGLADKAALVEQAGRALLEAELGSGRGEAQVVWHFWARAAATPALWGNSNSYRRIEVDIQLLNPRWQFPHKLRAI